MPFIEKAKTGLGCTVQLIGGILWIGCGLLMFVWTLYVLSSTFGIWTIFVGLLFSQSLMLLPSLLFGLVLVFSHSFFLFPMSYHGLACS